MWARRLICKRLTDRLTQNEVVTANWPGASELVEGWQVASDGRAPQKNWIGYVFAGLALCIGAFARAFPFLRDFIEKPFPKRAVITVIVAAVGTAITGAGV